MLPDPFAAEDSVPAGALAEPRLEPGSEPIPGYRLVRLVGKGGFGEVWRATGPGGFSVALKVLNLGTSTARLEQRSLETMKGIRHAYLLAIFGAWQLGRYLVIAMELADRSLLHRLRELTKQGQPGLPGPELLAAMQGVAKGLDHLNLEHHIQHRDIKPHNLLLVGGSVKVADFGLAKVLEEATASHTGGMSISYTPPEFFHGRTSPFSDQYSLAITYCQLRGGRTVFEGTQAQITSGHLMREPDLSMIPERERPAVARALRKEPTERWLNCRDFVEALAKAQGPAPAEKKGTATAPAPPKKPGRTGAPRVAPPKRVVLDSLATATPPPLKPAPSSAVLPMPMPSVETTLPPPVPPTSSAHLSVPPTPPSVELLMPEETLPPPINQRTLPNPPRLPAARGSSLYLLLGLIVLILGTAAGFGLLLWLN
jgi:serine/threonine protein kinase